MSKGRDNLTVIPLLLFFVEKFGVIHLTRARIMTKAVFISHFPHFPHQIVYIM